MISTDGCFLRQVLSFVVKSLSGFNYVARKDKVALNTWCPALSQLANADADARKFGIQKAAYTSLCDVSRQFSVVFLSPLRQAKVKKALESP